jgi:hypothetical protein
MIMTERKIVIQVIITNPDSELNKYSIILDNLYSYHLPRIKTKDMKKIVIYLTKEADLFDLPGHDDSAICTIHQKFDPIDFSNLDFDEKLSALNETIYDRLLRLYTHLEFETAGLKYAFQKIIDDNYKLKRPLCGIPKTNRKRNITATVFAEHFFEFALVGIEFCFKETGLIKTVPLFRLMPSPSTYGWLVSTAKWEIGDIFSVFNKTKEINYRVSVDGHISVNYNPIDRDAEGVKEQVVFFSYEIFFEM